jgi:hypothetical protein
MQALAASQPSAISIEVFVMIVSPEFGLNQSSPRAPLAYRVPYGSALSRNASYGCTTTRVVCRGHERREMYGGDGCPQTLGLPVGSQLGSGVLLYTSSCVTS